MPEQCTADDHLGVAFIALSNALRELEDTDWEEDVSQARDDVETALIAVREGDKS